jgi:hypothetical protein
MAFDLWSNCPHEVQTSMKIHKIEHGPPFSFGLCKVLTSCITSNNYVYKELNQMPLSSCKDTWYVLNNSQAQEQERITMAFPKLHKKILGYVYNQIARRMFEYKTT